MTEFSLLIDILVVGFVAGFALRDLLQIRWDGRTMAALDKLERAVDNALARAKAAR